MFLSSWSALHTAIESEILFIGTEYIARRIDTLSIFLATQTRLTGRPIGMSGTEGDRIVRTGITM